MTHQDICMASVEELHAAYSGGRISPVEVIEAVLNRAETLNPVLNAFCIIDPEAARSAARDSEARWKKKASLSLLDGIPISVKDLSVTKGWPTRRGSLAISEKGRWDIDAPSVARCREAGAVLFGKTTVPELGAKGLTYSQLCGTTKNPWNIAKTPGGSSGGATASIAAGIGTIALASDGGGSIRNPGALSGTFGFKPSFGVVPDFPLSYLGNLAVVGPMTRTVRDCAIAMSIIGRFDARDPYAIPSLSETFLPELASGVRGLRIAYSQTLGYARVNPEIATLVENAVETFVKLGATVEIVENVIENSKPTLDTLMAAGLANAMVELGITPAEYDKMDLALVRFAERGRALTSLEFLAARRAQDDLASQMRVFHERYDLLITPMMPVTAFDIGQEAPDDPSVDANDWKPFSGLLNLTRQPGATVPCGLSRAGLPVALQIIGPVYADALVLRAAHAFECEHAFPRLLPSSLANITQGA
jgi:aspartyl-tRNA(Asn)/glutamyl-tRNA(Gln) amidotransferase subunit A